MKIAITGASGLIGSALVASLRREGHDVSVELAGSVYPGYEWY